MWRPAWKTDLCSSLCSTNTHQFTTACPVWTHVLSDRLLAWWGDTAEDGEWVVQPQHVTAEYQLDGSGAEPGVYYRFGRRTGGP